jgi:radical SAM protein with 4Fe4S-binding SPASM domain
MKERQFSLILLPTLECNADCEYCFEDKSGHRLTLDRLAVILEKVMDYLESENIGTLSIYWQGGEVMTLPPEWFERANDIIHRCAEDAGKQVVNYIQSNMIGYTPRWNRVIAEMFGNSMGSSMDFPNLHRRLVGSGPREYERVWIRKVFEAREAGIQVGFIAIPNQGTLEMGAERFYSRIVDELGFGEFQINTPFAGGAANRVKDGYPLDSERLAAFLLDLSAVWLSRGYDRGVRVGPLDSLMNYFSRGRKDLLCVWRDNCVNEFVCIDPLGQVSQCDCWAASYPEFRFGNIFDGATLSDILRTSEARRSLRERPGLLIQEEDCIDCDYLGICHGGCPVRAYTVHGDIRAKDPYCALYRRLFAGLEELAASHARRAVLFHQDCAAREGLRNGKNPAKEK